MAESGPELKCLQAYSNVELVGVKDTPLKFLETTKVSFSFNGMAIMATVVVVKGISWMLSWESTS